ncbi:hypothetical protein LY76DRAFT_197768 [Colletotrichum caudatum]|nr:hypothetical protein LY76DRAFT_197768 [Colletotrichum caudatum]
MVSREPCSGPCPPGGPHSPGPCDAGDLGLGRRLIATKLWFTILSIILITRYLPWRRVITKSLPPRSGLEEQKKM